MKFKNCILLCKLKKCEQLCASNSLHTITNVCSDCGVPDVIKTLKNTYIETNTPIGEKKQ